MWVVARAKPGSMSLATRNLKQQDFNYYAPQLKETIVRRRKTIEVIKPLFSSYFFVEIDTRWRELRNTIGVSGFLCHLDQSPQYISQRIIDELRTREGPDGFYQPVMAFTPGQQLQATGGLLMGHFCICKHHTAVDRVRVLFSGLGFEFSTVMAVDDLEAA
jgi:transcriptional antiterminator RfaH